MKNYKEKILKMVMFWSMFAVLMLVLSYFITPDDKDVYDVTNVSRKKADIANEKDNSIDVIFVGDSEVYATFCPLIMYNGHGFTSYLLGTSEQKLCDSYNMLNAAFEKQSPKVIVLETGVFYRKAGNEVGSDEDFVEDLMQKRLNVVRYHSRWKNLMIKYMNKDNDQVEEAKQKGFRYRTNTQPYTGGEYMVDTEQVREFSTGVDNYIEKVRKLCEDNNAKLVLVSAPTAASWSMAQHNAVYNYANKENIDYIDMNLVNLGIDWNTDTKDKGIHLNFSGACKATNYMGNLLSTEYVLEDHRKNEDYKEWNEVSKEFCENKM